MFERIRQSKREPGEGGFTLIELLVVIIILGILAAVVVFAVGGVGDKGQSASCKIDVRTLRTAQEAHAGRFGTYTTEANLVTAGFLSEQSQYHNITYTAFDSTQPESATNPRTGTFTITSADTAKCPNP